MSQQEIDNVLDALEAEHGSFDSEDEPEIIKPQAKEKPPGFKTYDEWVALGKDPDDYKGQNAYNAEYERIQEIRELKDTMSKVATTTELWQKQQEALTRQQVEQARQSAFDELAKARDDDDVDAALIAQKKIDTMAPPMPQQNPIVSAFTARNPILDKNSDQFDADFFNDMAMMHDSTITQLTGGIPERQSLLTSAQIERSMEVSFKRAKELHPDKFKSPKNGRQSAPSVQKRGNTTAQPQRLSGYGGNSRNPRDVNPANDIYEMLKKSDPKAAETFRKNLEG